MEYKLSNKKGGIIITRQHSVYAGDMDIKFSGDICAKGPITVAFKNSINDELYRVLIDGIVHIPKEFLNSGSIFVRIIFNNIYNKQQVFICEPFNVQKLHSGELLICPSDIDMPNRIAKNELDVGEIAESIDFINKRIYLLEKKLAQILEGYDVE